MKPRSLLLLTLLAALAGCAIVPLDPYAAPRHRHHDYDHRRAHGDWR
ncbi:MAG TPA: hypothetical protein VFV74_06890 [Burkholderiales bacterium]|nr:hypothetical protein [Burkholderiales bacterium]